jgi:hypothetical protein
MRKHNITNGKFAVVDNRPFKVSCSVYNSKTRATESRNLTAPECLLTLKRIGPASKDLNQIDSLVAYGAKDSCNTKKGSEVQLDLNNYCCSYKALNCDEKPTLHLLAQNLQNYEFACAEKNIWWVSEDHNVGSLKFLNTAEALLDKHKHKDDLNKSK